MTTCVVCGKLDNHWVCNVCGARVDARRSLFEWFKTRKIFETELEKKIKFENAKRMKDGVGEFDFFTELSARLGTGYYKNTLDKIERRGKKIYGNSTQANEFSPLTGLDENEKSEYWKHFYGEIKRIKDNPLTSDIIYHYNHNIGEFYLGFDFFNDIIAENNYLYETD